MLPCNVQLSAIERDFMGEGGGGVPSSCSALFVHALSSGLCYTSISRLEESLHVNAKIVRVPL